MSRKVQRRLLRLLSRVPGLYSLLAFACARRVSVRGSSMIPTLLPGDRLLVDRFAYRRDRPRVGDIVLAAHPLRPGLRILKRIAEPPVGIVLGAGELWLLGDSDEMSSDSRQFGPVKRGVVLGRAWLRYWPTKSWRTFS